MTSADWAALGQFALNVYVIVTLYLIQRRLR